MTYVWDFVGAWLFFIHGPYFVKSCRAPIPHQSTQSYQYHSLILKAIQDQKISFQRSPQGKNGSKLQCLLCARKKRRPKWTLFCARAHRKHSWPGQLLSWGPLSKEIWLTTKKSQNPKRWRSSFKTYFGLIRMIFICVYSIVFLVSFSRSWIPLDGIDRLGLVHFGFVNL